MNIMFINSVLGGDYSALDVSLTQLSTYINKQTNHQASVLDMVFHRKKWKTHLKKGVRKNQPDVIAMSCNSLYMQYVRRIIKEVRKYEIPVVLGGYHATIKPEETLKIKGVKAIILGDGEFVLKEFLDRLENNKTVKGLKGVWAKENGKIIRNKEGVFIKDIDQFPKLDWDSWKDLKKYFYYLGMLYFVGSRGCPYRCTFCDAYQISTCVKGPYYRIRDPVKYADEINFQWQKYRKKGMRFAQLFDQVPTLDKKWLKTFCDEYQKQGEPDEHKYGMFSRIDHLNEEKIRMLAKSGCSILRMGVEAGNDYIRNVVYRKNLTKQKIRKIFSLCDKYGIGITAFYMIGGPGENRKTINETITFAKQLNASRSAFFIFKPFTKQCKSLLNEFGGVIDKERWKKADNITFDAVVKLKDLSLRQIERLQYKAYFTTFKIRLAWMIKESPTRYLSRLSTYVSRGLNDGLDIKYLLPYFHIYGDDYVSR